MKHKICSILLSLIILIGAAGFFPAAAEPDTADRVTDLVSGIAAYMEASDGSHSLQELLDGFISSYAGSGGEWFAIALKQAHPELDYSAYTKALLNVKETRKLPKLTDRQLISLALIFMDRENDPLVLQTAEENPSENGLMSHVFGLHLLNNLDKPDEARQHALELLDLRKPDGGWSLFGTYSDTDVTSMALQALAPQKDDPKIREAADTAFSWLSGKQLDDGGFNGMGTDNAESAAQVITALTSFGIDPEKDERFIKNGHTIIDALSAFSLPDGSFCHEKGLETNMTATTQAFYALISVKLLRDSGKSLYVYQQGKDVPPETEPSSETETASETEKTSESETASSDESSSEHETETASTKDEGASGSEASETDSADQTSSDGTDSEKTEPDQTEPGKTESDQTNSGQNDPGKSDPGQNAPGQNGRSSRKLSYKVYACAGVLVLVLAASLIQYFRKKRRFKNYLSVFLIGLGAVLLILFTDLKLPDSYYSSPVSHKEHPIGQVVLTIRCDTIKNEESPYIPKDGVILKDTVFEIEENDTVFDVLTEAVRAFNIQMETKGSVFSSHGQTFVSGLNYLYEFDYGELSGWVYHVNSITASVGAGEYVLKDGDYIEWLYTRDLGKDVEEGSSPLY